MDRLRHHNGSGSVIGNEAECSEDTLLDRKSVVRHRAQVQNSYVKGSIIQGTAHVYGSQIFHSKIGGLKQNTPLASMTKFPVIIDACILRSNVYCDSVEGCVRITDSALYHHARVLDSAVVSSSILAGHVTVCGDAEIIGLTLVGRHWIHAGKWRTPPRYSEIQAREGVRVGITECTNGRAHVGCKCLHLDEWLRGGDLFGRRAGWSVEAVALLRRLFTVWREECYGPVEASEVVAADIF